MKNIFVVLSLLVASHAFAKSISCGGSSGADDEQTIGTLTAQILNDHTLTLISWKYGLRVDQPVAFPITSLSADQNYHPRATKYQNMNRFQLGGSGWSNVSALFPSSIPNQGAFTGYMQSSGDDAGKTVALHCETKI